MWRLGGNLFRAQVSPFNPVNLRQLQALISKAVQLVHDKRVSKRGQTWGRNDTFTVKFRGGIARGFRDRYLNGNAEKLKGYGREPHQEIARW